MKKLLALFLAVILTLSFAACGSEQSGTNNGGTDNNGGSNQASGGVNLTHVTVDSGIYKNNFLGLEIEIPASWSCLSDAQIADLCGVSVDEIKGEEFKKCVDAYGSMLDFVGGTDNSEISMNVTVISPANYPLVQNASSLSEAEFAKKYVSTFEGQTVNDTETVKLGSKNYICVTISLSETNLTKNFYFCKVADYITMIDVTYNSNYTAESIKAMFK